jgi:mono/diheme cytochrome c family protein
VFGSIYGPNITPDVRTGIGTWSKEDFTRALRRGIRKDGALLYPAMPYVDYTKMTDDDLNALWAYLKSIPAVEHKVPDAEKTFKFPFNIRAGNAAWQALFFKPQRWKPVPDKTADWNRGDYLVTVLGHCGECHTPKDVAKAQELGHHLTGGQLEAWYAPDISNDPLSGISEFNVDQVAHFLKTGVLPNNTVAFGPMQETIHDSLSHLTDGDLHAIALYLKEQPTPKSQTPEKATISAQSLADGKNLYINNCSSCHQRDGKGLPGQVPALDGNTAVTASHPNDVVMAIMQGFGPKGTWGAMGSFAQLSNCMEQSCGAECGRVVGRQLARIRGCAREGTTARFDLSPVGAGGLETGARDRPRPSAQGHDRSWGAQAGGGEVHRSETQKPGIGYSGGAEFGVLPRHRRRKRLGNTELCEDCHLYPGRRHRARPRARAKGRREMNPTRRAEIAGAQNFPAALRLNRGRCV